MLYDVIYVWNYLNEELPTHYQFVRVTADSVEDAVEKVMPVLEGYRLGHSANACEGKEVAAPKIVAVRDLSPTGTISQVHYETDFTKYKETK